MSSASTTEPDNAVASAQRKGSVTPYFWAVGKAIAVLAFWLTLEWFFLPRTTKGFIVLMATLLGCGVMAGRAFMEASGTKPPGFSKFATILLAGILPFIGVFCGGNFSSSKTPDPDDKKVELAAKPEVVPWKPEELRQKYWFENAKLNGWVSSLPDTDTVVATYEVPATSEGPVMEAGVNVALMKGDALRMTCPQMDVLHQKVYVQIGEEGDWRVIHQQEQTMIQGDLGVVRVKVGTEGAATTLPISFTPIIQRTGDKNRVLVSTRGFGKAGQIKRWGVLPPSDEFDWKLYIRYTKLDGTALAKSYLTKTPGSFLVINEATGTKLIESSVTTNERIISSHEVNATGKESLILHIPHNPADKFRLDVKLLITPKGG